LLNAPDLDQLWAEDETIGWIYQFWNDPNERKMMREKSAAPRNSRELAVRNQFFTPRYVVEFLTDNTLGHIWYEMCRGETKLKEQCRYLVRRPNEIFLKPGENPPASKAPGAANVSPCPPSGGKEGQGEMVPPSTPPTQEGLLRQPVFIPHRPLKDPRTILMLDPACGSMHFGLYAFDLFEVVYAEYWDMLTAGGIQDHASRITHHDLKPLTELYTDKPAFLRDVPRLIIEHNIHGIDIDPRCAQIAGLSLWLRAQKAWQRLGLQPAERPRIKRSNIVCAEPMPGEKKLLREFVEREFQTEKAMFFPLLGKIFDKMQFAGEAGSLLKIEEEIRSAIEEERAKNQGELNFEGKRLSSDEFWQQFENRIYDALRDYAEQAENGGGFQRQLFAEDAARGFAFIDLCRKRYDVVVMNPPFGDASIRIETYLDENFPSWNKNLLCAFFSRMSNVLVAEGAVGAIFDRTAIVKSTYEDFRRAVFLSQNKIQTFADLGWGVLDANVETTCLTLACQNAALPGVFIDVRPIEPSSKELALLTSLNGTDGSHFRVPILIFNSHEFALFPNAVIGYDFPPFLATAFRTFKSLFQHGIRAYGGHSLKAERHNRVWWETSILMPSAFQKPMFNGAGFSPYTTPFREVVVSPCELGMLPKDSATVLRNPSIHGKRGLCFAKRGDFFCTHIAPDGLIFTQEGRPLPINNRNPAFLLAGLVNTPLFRYCLNRYCGQHKTSGYVNLFPIPDALFADMSIVPEVEKAIEFAGQMQSLDETQLTYVTFISPETVSFPLFGSDKLAEMIDIYRSQTTALEGSCEKIVRQYFGVTPEEMAVLDEFRLSQPKINPPFEDLIAEREIVTACVGGIVSQCVGAVFGRWDIRYATGEKAVRRCPTRLRRCRPVRQANCRTRRVGPPERRTCPPHIP